MTSRRYQVLETLGEGGTSTVYRAADRVLGREVALKVLTEAASAALGGDEFALLASHSHPNLVRVFDYGRTPEGRAFFTMELCRGADLLSWSRASGPATRAGRDPGLQHLLAQLLGVLDTIHTHGLAHNDLKPQNLLVEERETGLQLKLIDFGLSRPLRAAGAPGGTLEYLAPERIQGEPGDARSDLYSLGAILYELFAGTPPFAGPGAGEVIRGHLERTPDLDVVPPPYREVVARLLRKDPRERPPGALSVLEALLPEVARGYRSLPPFGRPLVGREGTLKQILAAVHSARLGRGRMVLLSGPTGAGKSRLLREVELRLQLEGTRVVSTSGVEGESPGGLVARFLARLAADTPPESAAREPLEALAGELARGAPAARDTGAESRNAAVESLLYRTARALLELTAERPAVLLADDVQWADTLSLESLAYLARSIEPAGSCRLALVAACRDETAEDRACLEKLGGGARGAKVFAAIEPIELGGLSVPEIDRYLRELLGASDAFPPELPPRLAEHTGGNPYFLEESLRLLAAAGGLERSGRTWRIRPGVEFTVPVSLEEAARERARLVSGPSRGVLEWLAVLGRPARAEELAELLGREEAGGGGGGEEPPPAGERLAAALGLCALDHLVRRSGLDYSLAHGAIRKAFYDAMEAGERRRRHRIAARWLETGGRLEEEGRLEQLASHLYAAGDLEAGREVLLQAGRRALLRGALREATVHLSRALEGMRDGAERFQALLDREEAWGQLGRSDRQREDLDRLSALASGLGDAARRETIAREALFLEAQGRKREALEKLTRALELAPEGRERARLLARCALAQLYLSEFPAAMARLDEALGLARSVADRPQEAECLQILGLGRYLQGEYDQALAHMERALEIRRELGDERRVGALESNLGLIQYDRGFLEAAEERFQSCLRTFRRIGLRRGEAVNLLNLGLVYSDMGRLERALDFIHGALAIRRELGDRHGEGADTGNLGAVWLRAGRLERAAPLFEKALAAAHAAGNQLSASANDARLGLVDLERGDLDRARERFERALAVAERAGGTAQKLLAATGLARCHLQAGRPGAALELAERALASAERQDMRRWRLECRALRAVALLDQDGLEEAESESRRAVEELEAFPGWLERSQEIWFVRHRVLLTLEQRGEKREGADAALRRAYTLLREKADAFEDPDLRRAFLENIALHREIDRLHAELQQRMRREAAGRERSFYEIARSVHSILDLEVLLDRLLELAIETTHAEKGLILLRGGDGVMTIRAARGMPRESVEDATDICQSVIDDVARGGEPVLARDAPSDDRFRERRSVISFHIRTLMCVPMKVREEVIGAVYVDGRGASSFTPEDLDFLVCFAQLAAVAVDNARLWSRLQAENLYLRRQVENRARFGGLIGRGPAMEQLLRLVEKVARTNASVLLTGETGTGKALIARAIHAASDRRSRSFVTVDCGALPESLLESELFGHRKGAFSGAIYDRVGLVEEAESGTLFLDEITNTTLDLQAKLLRVIQEGEIRRVGENQVRRVDVRIIAASNVDIPEAIRQGRFREDLYYRLNVVPVEVPPLRERREDIPLLAMHFLKKSSERLGKPLAGFTEEAMRLLEEGRWPGNVRELENVVEKAVILAEKDRIDAAFLRSLLPGGRGADVPPAGTGGEASSGESPAAAAAAAAPSRLGGADLEGLTLEEFDGRWQDAERAYLLELVERCGWNLSAAARRAGVRNRNTLVWRLKKHGLVRGERAGGGGATAPAGGSDRSGTPGAGGVSGAGGVPGGGGAGPGRSRA